MKKETKSFLKQIEKLAQKEYLRIMGVNTLKKLNNTEKRNLQPFIDGWVLSLCYYVKEAQKEYDQTLYGKVKNYATRIFS